jgi:hypothetical protein
LNAGAVDDRELSGFYPEVTASVNYNRSGDQWDVDGSRFADRENAF